MRYAVIGALFAFLPFSSVAFSSGALAAPADAENDAVLVAKTPIGFGDPDTMVCRASQRLAGSDQFGPKICFHNSEWKKLATNGKDLATDGKTIVDRPTVENPKGDGDPDDITCRTPMLLVSSSSRVVHHGPEVCQTNRFWADIIKNAQIVDADGVVRKRNDNLDMDPFHNPSQSGMSRTSGGAPL